MAFLASDGRMFAFQRIASQFVIEVFFWLFPVDQIKVGTVMLELTTNTISAVGVLHSQLCVIAVVVSKDLCNFFVAVEALERRRFGAELVAARTLRGARQGLVSLGKGARGYLGKRGGRSNR